MRSSFLVRGTPCSAILCAIDPQRAYPRAVVRRRFHRPMSAPSSIGHGPR
ncbi:MAG: hypothetical protein ACLTDR_04715 [Adlercreutzia equolifaciens]